MSLTILLEIGHDASVKTKISPEGFTHDWEVFVKGQNNSDIHYYVEKVVFHLHETFPKPKRVVKEPPFSLRTSGYAGFKLPIEIYLKNNQEPKKIKFNYDLDLQANGGPPIHRVQKEKYTFFNPSEEFRNKLLKGGAVEGSGKDEINVNRITSEERNQMTSKPKLSGSDITKKHRMKFDEPRNTDFENLFGPPIKKNSKLPEQPKPREPPPPKPPIIDKSSEKEKSDKSKSNKNAHKDKEKEKPKEKSSDSLDKKIKEEKKKSRDEKSKDRERSKEKSSKKDKEREKSPQARPRSPSPKRSPKRESSPPQVQKHSSTKEKESNKEEKKDKDRDKEKKDDKKSKKEKRDHKEGKHKDREKDKEHKEHKSKDKDKESKSSRDSKESSVNKLKESSPLSGITNSSQNMHKTDKKLKDKEHGKEQLKEAEKSDRIEKEKMRPESEEKEREKDKDKDRQNKHKHKKKDRKEKKEEKHSKKEERKNEKQPILTSNSKDVAKEMSVPSNREVDKNNLFGSPKSDSALTPKESDIKQENNTLFSRDDESSNDSVKMSSREASPVPRIPSQSPSPPPPPEPIKKPELDKKKDPSPKKKDKKEKKKEKKVDKDHEKKKKRKSDSTSVLEAEPPEKVPKIEENNSDEESKVSSTEDAAAIVQPKSECDMDMLRDLQQRIINLKDSADLQRVVQLIAETGQYEVSAHTFDFDLCLLDRSTVRQLQDFFSIS